MRRRRTQGVHAAIALVGVLITTAELGLSRTRFLTDELIVNTHTTNRQFAPAVAAAGDGSFVIVWTSLGQEGGASAYAGVFGQRFDVSASRLGTEFHVNSYTTNSQFRPEVAAAPTGEFVVVWTSFRQAEEPYTIFGRRFSKSALSLGSEFPLDSNIGSQNRPSLSATADGEVVAVWRRYAGGEVGGGVIFSRLLSAINDTLGPIFPVNAYTTGIQRDPAVVALPSGEFVAIWQDGLVFEDPDTRDGSGGGIFARMLNGQAEPIGEDFQVNTTTLYAQFAPSVAAAGDSGFVVAWGGQNPPPRYSEGVFFQQFDLAARPVGTEAHVNPPGSEPQLDADEILIAYTDVASNESGFLVVWSDYYPFGFGSGSKHVLGRSYTPDGNPRGPVFIVNESVDSYAYDAHVASIDTNHFVVVWSTGSAEAGYHVPEDVPSVDGDSSGIAARALTVFAECGDADDNGKLTAADALAGLRTSVGTGQCPLCVCDVNWSGDTTAGDALALLQRAIGIDVVLLCSDTCGATTTTTTTTGTTSTTICTSDEDCRDSSCGPCCFCNIGDGKCHFYGPCGSTVEGLGT